MKTVNIIRYILLIICAMLLVLAVISLWNVESERRELARQKAALKAAEVIPINTLTEQEKKAGWKLLFDGETTRGWRGAHMDTFPGHGWKVENGELIVLKSDGSESTNGGDIVTEAEYSAFMLSLEFKISPGANSGIKYFVTEAEEQKGSAYGLEYQILDNELHPDAKLYTTYPGSRTLGSLYDLIPAKDVYSFGVGEWNRADIVVLPNSLVIHFLNGIPILTYKRGSAEFRERVRGSKYADKAYNQYGPFGEAPSGHILLQDHGSEVAFRNIKIRELK